MSIGTHTTASREKHEGQAKRDNTKPPEEEPTNNNKSLKRRIKHRMWAKLSFPRKFQNPFNRPTYRTDQKFIYLGLCKSISSKRFIHVKLLSHLNDRLGQTGSNISVLKPQSTTGLVKQSLLSWFTAMQWNSLRRDSTLNQVPEMTNSASPWDRAEAQKSDSSWMQSKEAFFFFFFLNFTEFSTSASH